MSTKNKGSYLDGKTPRVDSLTSNSSGLAPEVYPDDWRHLKRYGFAPGNYMSKCHRCGFVICGLDKRATCCRPCAIAADRALNAVQAAEPTERERWEAVAAYADDMLCRMNEAPGTHVRESWKVKLREVIVALRTGAAPASASYTDCRTDEGVTVGLIDTIINSARLLAGRDQSSPAVVAALSDLRGDENVAEVLATAPPQAAAEPVAWRVPLEGHTRSQFTNGVPSPATVKYWADQGIALEYAYAAPQPAQPLTDDQILQIASTIPRDDLIHDFARAVERAHGITGTKP